MITREDIRELAQLQCIEDEEGCALSFYFQPRTPQNKSHREEAILLKDLVRDTIREAEKDGKNESLRRDLQRVVGCGPDRAPGVEGGKLRVHEGVRPTVGIIAGTGSRVSQTKSLIQELKRKRVHRIDTSVHNGNDVAEKFYRKNGFVMLGEERLTLLL